MRTIGHFVGGKEVAGASGRFGDVFNPNTGEVQARVARATRAEVEQAIGAAAAGSGLPATSIEVMAVVARAARARLLIDFLPRCRQVAA